MMRRPTLPVIKIEQIKHQLHQCLPSIQYGPVQIMTHLFCYQLFPDLERELQNSLWRPNLMILASVWFLANRHILLAIGDLQEIKSDAKRANLAPNGVLQFP